MRKSFLSVMLLLSVAAQAQLLNVKTPTILPSSPEASSIIKADVAGVTLNTGSASTNIPFYELKMNGFSVPIGLGYSTTGLRVDEVPGRVGMNWSMSGTGVVTRSVQGAPDDYSARLAYPSDFVFNLGATQEDITFLNNLTNSSGNDNQPDEFMVSAPGLSLRFILDNAGNPLQIPFSNVKIDVVGGPFHGSGYFSDFIVTNTNGVKYYFGGANAYENTNSHNIPALGGFSSIRTGFFLTKIKSPVGDSVVYTYSPLSIMVHNSVAFNVQRPDVANNVGQSCPNGTTCADGTSVTEQLNSVGYATRLLTNITGSNGTSINFTYQNRNDNSQDKLLQDITVSNSGDSKSFKCYYTEYATQSGFSYNSLASYNKRFFLTGVTLPSTSTPADSLRYSFVYESPASLPPRLSYCQDYWGYFNNTNNFNLLPKISGVDLSYANADRAPNESVASYGSLTRVNLPTGGYQEFVYEPNQVAIQRLIEMDQSVYVSGSGDATSGWIVNSSSTPIVINRPMMGKFTISAYQNPGCSSCTPAPPNTMTFLKAEILDASNSNVVFSKIMREYGDIVWDVPLDPGKTYTLKLSVKEQVNAGTLTMVYDNYTAPAFVNLNVPAGGIRVKQIKSYDPVADRTYSKYYKYTRLNSDLSSAVSTYEMKFDTRLETKTMCSCEGSSPNGPFCNVNDALNCRYIHVNSNSAAPVSLFNGSHLGYESIIESDSPQMVNGGILHEYSVFPIFAIEQLCGYEILNLPTSTTSTYSGNEVATRYFDKNLSIQKEVLNFYGYYPQDTAKEYRAIAARQRFPYATQITPDMQFFAFDAATYLYKSEWVRLDSTVQNEYDYSDRKLTTTTTYQYGSSKNTSPVGTTSRASNGDIIVNQIKYATDFPGTSPYTIMVQKNLITEPVEQKELVNSVQVAKQNTDYFDWSGNGAMLKPQYIKSQKFTTDAQESRLQFYAYDNLGNPLEFSKDKDAHSCYVWDYNNTIPIAEIKNAAKADIAYTSFEADGKGNFTFTGAPVANTTAPTGKKVYTLTSFPISKSGLTIAGKYTISYWSNSGSYTISGTSANTVQTGRTMGAWVLYIHQVTASATTLSISGSGLLDELRLCPQDAMMTSLTYSPLFGVTSQSDANNRIVYYSYDGLGRLQVIKDQDGNIIKTVNYYYKNGN
jgi:YD repeat-containing protein